VRGIFIFSLLFLAGIHARSQEFACVEKTSGFQECTYTEFHPSGPTVYREWRYSADSDSVTRVVLGATAGSRVIDSLFVRLGANSTWVLSSVDDVLIKLPAKSNGNHGALRVKMESYSYRIKVCGYHWPRPSVHFASEDAPRIDLAVVRSRLPQSSRVGSEQSPKGPTAAQLDSVMGAR